MMESQHRLFWLSMCLIIHHALARPCGVGSICSCYPEISMITCAAKGITEMPSLMTEDKLMCKILILDSNNIRSLDEFVIHDWPQLEELRVRKNPDEICMWIDAIKLELRGKLVVLDDCQHRNMTVNDANTTHQSPVSDAPTTISASKVSETTTPATKRTKMDKKPTRQTTTATTKHANMDKKDTRDGNHAGCDCSENSVTDDGEGQIFTTHGNRNVKIGMTTADYAETNTTAQTWSITGSITGEGLTVLVSIPVTLFGIGMIVIRIVWKKRRPRYLGFNVGTGNSLEMAALDACAANTATNPKKKWSPTPSMTSETVEFDRTAVKYKPTVRRKSRESEYLYFSNITNFIHLYVIHISSTEYRI